MVKIRHLGRVLLGLATLFVCCGLTATAQQFVTSQAPTNGEWDAETFWYNIKITHSSTDLYLTSYTTDTENSYLNLLATSSLENSTLGDAELWCIVGNETNGYQFYNKSAGTTKVLAVIYKGDASSEYKMVDVTTEGLDASAAQTTDAYYSLFMRHDPYSSVSADAFYVAKSNSSAPTYINYTDAAGLTTYNNGWGYSWTDSYFYFSTDTDADLLSLKAKVDVYRKIETGSYVGMYSSDDAATAAKNAVNTAWTAYLSSKTEDNKTALETAFTTADKYRRTLETSKYYLLESKVGGNAYVTAEGVTADASGTVSGNLSRTSSTTVTPAMMWKFTRTGETTQTDNNVSTWLGAYNL